MPRSASSLDVDSRSRSGLESSQDAVTHTAKEHATSSSENAVVPHKLTALKHRHAEHLLKVVRSAEQTERDRQKKLRHATSKANAKYLQRRFDTERRRDQSRIAGLVEDTQAIEEALLQATLGPSTVEHAQTRIATSLESHRRMKHEGSVGFGEGSGDGVNISSPVGTIGGPTAKGFAKSNAYIQRSDEKENSRFISTQQMLFKKYMYKHVDGMKQARPRAGPNVSQNGRNSSRKRPARQPPNDGKQKSDQSRNTGATNVQPRASSHLARRGFEIPCSDGRRRLLAQKRGILIELKQVVSRQAEALDCLVETSGSPVRKAAPTRELDARSWRSAANERPRAPSYVGSGSCSTGDLNDRSAARIYNATTSYHRSVGSSSTAPSRGGVMAIPPRPPDNATSTFLAQGGIWGKEAKHGPSSRHSVASSVSYATYGRDLAVAPAHVRRSLRAVPRLTL